MIGIVDYGVGNIQAILNVYDRLNVQACRVRTPSDLNHISRLILPGVGSFDRAMQLLNQSGLRESLEDIVLLKKVPILGVCVGFQMLASSSEEGIEPGLNWIPGRVSSFTRDSRFCRMPSPHMGWNCVNLKFDSKLFKGLDHYSSFYFLHSYFFDCDDKSYVTATSHYSFTFDCAISFDNIHGVQFHPEKSHEFGAKLLLNFAEF
jgi:glutamine amidotransferase